MSKQRGLSLIEVSVVLLIVAIMMGAILQVVNTQMASARIKATKTNQDAVKTALINFVTTNYRMPCPARANLAQGNANYGVEATSTNTTCSGTTNVGNGVNRNSRGIIPWKTLGLTDEAAADGYGRRFTYQVLHAATRLDSSSISTLTGNIDIWEDNAGGNQINLNHPAVAVIVSYGEDGLGAYMAGTGTQIAQPANGTQQRENTDNDTDFVQAQYRKDLDNANNTFDDVVMWLTANDLLVNLQESDTTTSSTLTATKQLESVKNALVSYIVADNADPDGGGARTRWRRLPYADRTNGGGANNGQADNNRTNGNAPWVDLGLPQATVTDPWGNYIEYTVDNTLARSNNTSGLTASSPNASTTAFSLSASGDDGTLGTADDITLSITVAELRGLLITAGVYLDP